MRFFLVDKVLEIHPGEFVKGLKNVTYSDEILHDHFPDHPLYPGTFLLESLAQLAGFLVEVSTNREEGNPRRAVLCQIDKAKFYVPVRPGDQLILHGRLLSTLEAAAQVEAEAMVLEKRVARATLTFALREVDSEKVHQQRRDLYRLWTRELDLKFPIR